MVSAITFAFLFVIFAACSYAVAAHEENSGDTGGSSPLGALFITLFAAATVACFVFMMFELSRVVFPGGC